jgi:hypothetical protein
MGILEGPIGFKSNQIGTYTSANNKDVDFSLEALLEIAAKLPKPPECLVFNIKEFKLLPENTLFVSSDLAEKLERIIKESEAENE